MDEKWSMDFKKLRKSSSKKLIKGGLGFFLSPRDDVKEVNQETSATVKDMPVLAGNKRANDWGNESLQDSSNEIDEHEKDFTDGIPIIPSIDDYTDDDLTSQIATAPLIGTKEIVTYKDLENDVLKHSAFASFEEVNLQVLIKGLHPDSSLNEPDTPWTKDGLFYELVSKVNERKML